MNLSRIILTPLFAGIITASNAQVSQKISKEDAPFLAQKICNLESTTIAEAGEFQFNVSHRFGDINGGIKTFFGLDQSNTKIELVYGIADLLQLGVSRESLRRTYSGSLKMAFLKQREGMPINVSGYTSIHANTAISSEQYPKMVFYDRLSYASQLLISTQIGSRFSLELAPTYVRQNLVLEPFQQHNQFLVGLGTRVRLTPHISTNLEYIPNFSRARESIYSDVLALGIDFETNGHVFQLLISNAQGTAAPAYLSNAEGDIWSGTLFLGFNITRKF